MYYCVICYLELIIISYLLCNIYLVIWYLLLLLLVFIYYYVLFDI